MNTGQMLITIGAMFLLSLTILNVNKGYLNNSTVVMETKFNIMAISLAVSLIEDANGKSFDENTSTAAIIGTNALSAIGKDSGEYFISRDNNNFDDFDDYDGLSYSTSGDSTLISAVYYISCSVHYAKETQPDRNAGAKTWYKRLDVEVTSPTMVDTIRMSTIMSYFYFR
ncbi:MAG: hypothetical protein PHW27_07985 [Melioribacteraceae bacterium]|nr:hypothetical protein [Melioribacteraceae bacterium]MDD3558502.1 hypothetical protein [Melioribacteraceae bacterium]